AREVGDQAALRAVEAEGDRKGLVLEIAGELQLVVGPGFTQLLAGGGAVGERVRTPHRGSRATLFNPHRATSEPAPAEPRDWERVDRASERAERQASVPSERARLYRCSVQ